MRYIEITNIERDLFKPTQITFVGNNRMFVTERLFLNKVGTDMNDRYIFFENDLNYIHYRETYSDDSYYHAEVHGY